MTGSRIFFDSNNIFASDIAITIPVGQPVTDNKELIVLDIHKFSSFNP